MYDLQKEKHSVLTSTYETLRHELHTMKQTYKMKCLSVVLKKRSTIYHLNQQQQKQHHQLVNGSDLDIVENPVKKQPSGNLTAE